MANAQSKNKIEFTITFAIVSLKNTYLFVIMKVRCQANLLSCGGDMIFVFLFSCLKWGHYSISLVGIAIVDLKVAPGPVYKFLHLGVLMFASTLATSLTAEDSLSLHTEFAFGSNQYQ